MKENKSSKQTRIISGYAVKWGSWSSLINENGIEFYEQIEQGSFKESLEDKYQIACYKHDLTKEVASVDAGTLILKENSVGLCYEIYLPDTKLGKLICSEMDDGLLSHVSVGFKDAESTWETLIGENIRTIRKAKLYEISLVKNPAYWDTSIVNRGSLSSDMIVTQIENILLEEKRRELLLEIKKALR